MVAEEERKAEVSWSAGFYRFCC